MRFLVGCRRNRGTEVLLALIAAVALLLNARCSIGHAAGDVRGRVRSADGVEIAYSARGSGDIALVFIHGGLADRSFWEPQLSSLSKGFRIVAVDLAGHGQSGLGRKSWTIPSFGQDVQAVVEALALRRPVLVGNSLGGPVALEAARLLRGQVLGVVGVDTFQDATVKLDPAQSHARAEAFRKDFPGTCRAMVGSLFHPGTHRELHEWAELRMCAMPPEVVADIMEGFAVTTSPLPFEVPACQFARSTATCGRRTSSAIARSRPISTP